MAANPSKPEQNKPAASRPRKWLHAWWRPMLAVLASAVVVAGVVLLVWLVPPALYQHVHNEQARVGAEASTRTGLIAGLAGLAALGGLVLTARNVQINRQTLEATQRTQNETLRLTEQGHLTDRYTKAIEQLGSAKLDVRLGDIYALERIAGDSERDHPTVVEVLQTFVSEHSRPRPSRGHRRPSPSTERIATDVQAAIDVLLRLPGHPGLPLVQLDHAHLSHAHLGWATLTRARLDEATLTGANLNGRTWPTLASTGRP